MRDRVLYGYPWRMKRGLRRGLCFVLASLVGIKWGDCVLYGYPWKVRAGIKGGCVLYASMEGKGGI